MKLDKFTRICIKIVLILLIALLLKSLIVIPRDLYAKGNVEYSVYAWNDEKVWYEGEGLFNKKAQEGWKLHSCYEDGKKVVIIFER